MRRSGFSTTHAIFGCSFALLATPALAQNDDRQVRAPSNDANAREQAPKEPAIPAVAPNSPAGIFGGRHQTAISSDAGFSISHTSISGGGSITNLTLRPAIDYFVMDNFSVGGFLGIEYDHTAGGHATTFSIGPRVGYNIAFSELFSVWPKVGLSFASTSNTGSVTLVNPSTGAVTSTTSDTNSTSLQINLFVPVMLHPAPHFFVGFGPALDVDVSGDHKATTIAGRLTLGGWL